MHTSAVQSLASVVHAAPFAALWAWHAPDPLQVSGLSQSVSDGSPHVVPKGSFGCVQSPPLHTSAVQSLASVVHAAPFAALLAWHAPDPLQVSGLSQSVSDGSPHVVPKGSFGCVQSPPLHTSTVQSLASVVHAAPFAALLAWHAPDPLQVSGLWQSVSDG